MGQKEIYEKLETIYGEHSLLAVCGDIAIHIGRIESYILNRARVNEVYKIDEQEVHIIDIAYFFNNIMNGDFAFYKALLLSPAYVNPDLEERFKELQTATIQASQCLSNYLITSSLAERAKLRENALKLGSTSKQSLLLFMEYSFYIINHGFIITNEQRQSLDLTMKTAISVNTVKTIIKQIDSDIASLTQGNIDTDIEVLRAVRTEFDGLIVDTALLRSNVENIFMLL